MKCWLETVVQDALLEVLVIAIRTFLEILFIQKIMMSLIFLYYIPMCTIHFYKIFIV